MADNPKVDERLYRTIWGEVTGGPPEEVKAVTSVFLNRAKKEGYEKALLGSSAYRKKSPQYQKAERLDFNPYERALWLRNRQLISSMLQSGQTYPYYYFENVNAFGTPPWAKGLQYQDVGRQRFYYPKETNGLRERTGNKQ